MTTYPPIPAGGFQGYQNDPGGFQGYQSVPGGPPTGYPNQPGGPPAGYPNQPGGPPTGYLKQPGGPPTGYPYQSGGPPPAYPNQSVGPPPTMGFVPQTQPPGTGYQEPQQEDDDHVPSAPPINEMEKFPGYEHVTFDSVPMAPPAYVERHKEPPSERPELGRLPTISEEQVRQSLMKFAEAHCCYGKSPARDLAIRDIRMSSAFQYTLETFGEKRETAWVFEPYSDGQPVDSPMNGPAPAPWDVLVLPQAYFQDAVSKVEVPHTATIRPCHICIGMGRVRCKSCLGDGQNRCTSCHHGQKGEERCTWCNGTGTRRCMRCSGEGQVKCKTCSGKGNLKCFVQLTVTWKNHLEDFISDKVSLPDDCIRRVSGQIAFKEQHPRVWPINSSPDQKVNEASTRLVQEHSGQFTQERILQQRHSVKIVPVAEVSYSWKEDQGDFFVYGFENRVFFPDYPQKCCCGCCGCCVIL